MVQADQMTLIDAQVEVVGRDQRPVGSVALFGEVPEMAQGASPRVAG
jgi:hypothetical protein